MAISDTRSTEYQDSDVFSTTDRVRLWAVADEENRGLGSSEGEISVKDGFRSFDTRQGVIRDIRYIQSKFLGIFITSENLETVLNSTNTQNESQALALSLLARLLEGWRVKEETLDALESDWTGRDRGLQTNQQRNFLVVVTVTAYLTPDWEQTRELCYLAVEEGAVDDLLKHAGRRLAQDHTLSDLPFVGKDAFSSSISTFRHQSAKENLLACISRICLSTGILSVQDNKHKDAFSVISVERSDEGAKVRTDTVLKLDAALNRDFIRGIYDRHKIGRNEPFCPFLRASSILDELGLPGDSSPSQHESRWFRGWPGLPDIDEHRVLVAYSSNPITGSAAPRLCLFVTDPAGVRSSRSYFRDFLQSEPPWHFRVRRYDNKRGWSNGWNQDLKESVKTDKSILRQLGAFVEALQELDADRPREMDDTDINETEQLWAPKRPNTLWDVLLTDGLEFMSEATTAFDISQNQRASTGSVENFGRIRQIHREDTPRQSLGPKPKSKQPEFMYPVESDNHKNGNRDSNMGLSASTVQNMVAQYQQRQPSLSIPHPPVLGKEEALPTHFASSWSQPIVIDDDPGPSCPVSSKRCTNSETQNPFMLSTKRQRISPPQEVNSAVAGLQGLYMDDDTVAKLLADGFFTDMECNLAANTF